MVRKWKARTKGMLRRGRDILLPDEQTRKYRKWIAGRLLERRLEYPNSIEPGLLSIITPVWDGSPVRFLRELAQSISHQIASREAEWMLLDNGCRETRLLACLRELGRLPFVTILTSEANLGIVAGLHYCLEKAANSYVLPVDADDKLYPDALKIVSAFIRRSNYPPLLYSDEDKVSAGAVYQPYCKPDWDPVLLSNSAYIAHLGVADRALALTLGAYTDGATEGSADWDLFMRFANAGHQAVHIPEIVYSWRIHAHSTADDVESKPYIVSSQRAVMQRFLHAHPNGHHYRIETNTLFGPHAAHFRYVRKHPFNFMEEGAFTPILAAGVKPVDPAWIEEALALFELFPDTVLVGGRLATTSGVVENGTLATGLNLADPGYFGSAWKTRSAMEVSNAIALARTAFLEKALSLRPTGAEPVSAACEQATKDGCRVIYSPFIVGIRNGQSATTRQS